MAKAKKTTSREASKLKFTPSEDKVLIKPLSNKGNETASGIILPDSAQEEKTDRGLVVAVGEGKYNDAGVLIPISIKVGDKVLFQWGEKTEIDEEEYYIVGATNILGTFK